MFVEEPPDFFTDSCQILKLELCPADVAGVSWSGQRVSRDQFLAVSLLAVAEFVEFVNADDTFRTSSIKFVTVFFVEREAGQVDVNDVGGSDCLADLVRLIPVRVLVDPLLHEVRCNDLDLVIVESSRDGHSDVSIDVGETVKHFFRSEARHGDNDAGIRQRLASHRVVIRLDRRRAANEITQQHHIVTPARRTDQSNQ